nr:PREDICTED: drebrin-like protein A [Lepisosteus oculatus]
MKSINLDTYSLSLLTAKEDILNPRSSTNWALFTYDGATNNLKLSDSGAGGVAELAKKFQSSHPLYGLCKIAAPGGGLPRIVMVIWVGQDVPEPRRSECASHVPAVKAFFKEAHVFISATGPEEVTEESIDAVIGKIAPPVDRVRRVPRPAGSEETVGTNYRKTNAAMEMRRINRDSFWARAEREEEQRKEEERRRVAEERRRWERERVLQERREAEERERKLSEKEQLILEQRRMQALQEAEARKLEKAKWEAQQREHEEEMRVRFRRSESIEKAAEAAVLVSQRSMNPREFFRQLSSSSSSHNSSSPVSPRSGKPTFRRYQRSLTDTAFIFGRCDSSTPTSPRSPTVVSPFSPSPFPATAVGPLSPSSPEPAFQPGARDGPGALGAPVASPPTSPPRPALRRQRPASAAPQSSPAPAAAPDGQPPGPALPASPQPDPPVSPAGPGSLSEAQPAPCIPAAPTSALPPDPPAAPSPPRTQEDRPPAAELHMVNSTVSELKADLGTRAEAVYKAELDSSIPPVAEEEEEEDAEEEKKEEEEKEEEEEEEEKEEEERSGLAEIEAASKLEPRAATEPYLAGQAEPSTEVLQTSGQEDPTAELCLEPELVPLGERMAGAGSAVLGAARATEEDGAEVVFTEPESEAPRPSAPPLEPDLIGGTAEEDREADRVHHAGQEPITADTEQSGLEREEPAVQPANEGTPEDERQQENGEQVSEQNGTADHFDSPDTDLSAPVVSESSLCAVRHDGMEEDSMVQEQEQEVQKEEENGEESPEPERKLCVRALCDYQAEDDSELSLEPGDIISVVEAVDQAWWRGCSKDGRQGLFPAKYVEPL